MVVAIALLAVITICWLYLLAGAGTGMYPHEMAMLNPVSERMDMPMAFPEWTPGYTLLMFGMWWLMMIAMMLPSAAPMVLLHATVTRNAQPTASARHLVQTTTAFVAGYLVMWGAFSLLAVIAQWILQREGLLSPMMTSTSRLLGAALLLVAGLWQLTPLKAVCLRRCRSPIGFLSTHWRTGTRGAFGMGVKHGAYCLGCCWFLMALLFFGGIMNLIWIAGLALIVLIEKLTPGGELVGKIIGVLLIGWGAWLGVAAT